ncbi:hypothetical protein ACXX84_01780 [Mycoplasma sp. AC157]
MSFEKEQIRKNNLTCFILSIVNIVLMFLITFSFLFFNLWALAFKGLFLLVTSAIYITYLVFLFLLTLKLSVIFNNPSAAKAKTAWILAAVIPFVWIAAFILTNRWIAEID